MKVKESFLLELKFLQELVGICECLGRWDVLEKGVVVLGAVVDEFYYDLRDNLWEEELRSTEEKE